MTKANFSSFRAAIRAAQLVVLLVASAACAQAGELRPAGAAEEGARGEQHYLYVAVPGVRRYLEYGGHGLLVFDVADNHRFVKRIPVAGLLRSEATLPKPSNRVTPDDTELFSEFVVVLMMRPSSWLKLRP